MQGSAEQKAPAALNLRFTTLYTFPPLYTQKPAARDVYKRQLYDILVETPPTKVLLMALDQGLWDCERSLAERSALCEANHMDCLLYTSRCV